MAPSADLIRSLDVLQQVAELYSRTDTRKSALILAGAALQVSIVLLIDAGENEGELQKFEPALQTLERELNDLASRVAQIKEPKGELQ